MAKLTSRNEDYSKWYNEFVTKADLAEAFTGRTRGARTEAGGCDPQGTRGSIRWCIPQEARPSGILPPGSS